MIRLICFENRQIVPYLSAFVKRAIKKFRSTFPWDIKYHLCFSSRTTSSDFIRLDTMYSYCLRFFADDRKHLNNILTAKDMSLIGVNTFLIVKKNSMCASKIMSFEDRGHISIVFHPHFSKWFSSSEASVSAFEHVNIPNIFLFLLFLRWLNEPTILFTA